MSPAGRACTCGPPSATRPAPPSPCPASSGTATSATPPAPATSATPSSAPSAPSPRRRAPPRREEAVVRRRPCPRTIREPSPCAVRWALTAGSERPPPVSRPLPRAGCSRASSTGWATGARRPVRSSSVSRCSVPGVPTAIRPDPWATRAAAAWRESVAAVTRSSKAASPTGAPGAGSASSTARSSTPGRPRAGSTPGWGFPPPTRPPRPRAGCSSALNAGWLTGARRPVRSSWVSRCSVPGVPTAIRPGPWATRAAVAW